MAIQMRRGNYSDFNPNQMVPGEWAVCISDGNKRVFMCFARPGDVIEIPTVESIVDTHEVEEIRDEAVDARDAAEQYAEQAEASTITNITATVDNNVGTPSVDVTKTSVDPAPKTFRFDFKNIKGVKGDTGVSVDEAYIDARDHLMLVYTDSTQAVPHIDDAGMVSDGNKMIEVTQAQYDALPEADKNNPDLYYWIIDAQGIAYTSGNGSGTDDYRDLTNKPRINNVELNGNKSLSDLGIPTNIPTAIQRIRYIDTLATSITLSANSTITKSILFSYQKTLGNDTFAFENIDGVRDTTANGSKLVLRGYFTLQSYVYIQLYNPTDESITASYDVYMAYARYALS